MTDYNFYHFFARGQSEEYVLNKERSIDIYKGYMINRLLKMFKYDNLPETIPQYMLEYYLLSNGSCVIAKKDDNLYAFMGSFGGEPDVYYRPTQYIVANPGLRFDKTFPLWTTTGYPSKECVFMRNDLLWMGLNPLMSRYAYLLAENTITMRTANIMLRVVAMLTAPDDKTRIAGEAYLKDLEKGKLGVIAENRFFDGIKLQSPPSNNGSYLTQFIELHQYYLASFYNEVGLSSNYNMKRSALRDEEIEASEEVLAPLVESMYTCRMEDVSRLNDLFGLNISVQFDSAWLKNFLQSETDKLSTIDTAEKLAAEPPVSISSDGSSEAPEPAEPLGSDGVGASEEPEEQIDTVEELEQPESSFKQEILEDLGIDEEQQQEVQEEIGSDNIVDIGNISDSSDNRDN